MTRRPFATRAARGALVAAVAAALTSGAVVGCSTTSDRSGASDTGEQRTLTVLAAASLTETFTDLARRFEADHPGVDVRLAFDSSATLARQVAEGAPADVLATADARTMRTATDAAATSREPSVFATNTLVLVAPRGDAGAVRRFDDLRRDDVAYVMCVESAPCGALARADLDINGVTRPPKSLEVDVKAVLHKVELGEADAGLVYATDAVADADKVRALTIPNTSESVTSYLVAPLSDAASPELASAWVRLVLSQRGQRLLARAGFGRA